RERRRKKHPSGASEDLDADSQEALSIDASMTSVNDLPGQQDRSKHLFQPQQRRSRSSKCKSVNLDLISASRSPSARVEPPYRTRFADHHFACTLSVTVPLALLVQVTPFPHSPPLLPLHRFPLICPSHPINIMMMMMLK
ncbi:hypothetical protein Ciccas_006769, partial [Cichlidogyrus casuarinus]